MRLTLALLLLLISTPFASAAESAACQSLRANAKEGDLVFLEIDNFLFRSVAETSSSWTAHVGIVLAKDNQLQIYESAVFYSRITDLCAFVQRSKGERFALTRPHNPLREEELVLMRKTATDHLGIFYDTGFDLDSTNEFCSKFTYQVYQAAGRTLGKVESFRDLLNGLPAGAERDALEGFWRRWFYAGFRFSGIPWERRTVTPASQLRDRDFDLILGKREI